MKTRPTSYKYSNFNKIYPINTILSDSLTRIPSVMHVPVLQTLCMKCDSACQKECAKKVTFGVFASPSVMLEKSELSARNH